MSEGRRMGSDGDRRLERARASAEALKARDVRGVALTVVDNAGVTRVKTVPIERLVDAAAWGVGMSPVFDVFLVNDDITTSELIGGPDGDLRLLPDPARLTPLAAQPGWAWAPADKFTQDGVPFAACQRSFARGMAERATEAGIELQMSFEVEWVLGRRQDADMDPIANGPAYGMDVLIHASDFARDLLEAFQEQGTVVEQFHPEYSPGQLEISLAPGDPVAAADVNVLVRQTIKAVARRHGLAASFAPAVVAGQVGNGGHVHFSVWRGETNLFAEGDRRHGLTDAGESFLAGILDALPALSAVGAPSVASYGRLVPSHWAGAYGCWGLENREAAIRFVTGSAGARRQRANAEVKCFDASANPYLVAGAMIVAGLDGMRRGLELPPEVRGDPALRSKDELRALGVARLPESLEEALSHLERCELLREAMGEALFGAFVAVRRGEWELFRNSSPEEVVAASRWRY
jgi:glutamine synthetase